jgi:hypothetical protein
VEHVSRFLTVLADPTHREPAAELWEAAYLEPGVYVVADPIPSMKPREPVMELRTGTSRTRPIW